jgi:hypothetical protein
MSDFDTLESIFQMMEPSDFTGAKKLALGKKAGDVNVIKEILDVLYNAGASGAMTSSDMIQKIDNLLTNSPNDAKDTFKNVFHVFTSDDKQPKKEFVNELRNKSNKNDNVTSVEKTSFVQIVGEPGDLSKTNKKMSIFLLNSPFFSPAMRNAERCEIFLNSIPSIHASRMTPILDVEFAFHRSEDDKTSFGQMKFLLGNEKIVDDTPTAKIIASRIIKNESDKSTSTSMGMEMFTSPQTLVNASPVDKIARYNDVLDPFRPFASIESFTVNCVPAVGLFSQKKATLIIKLHDRSRMSEIADLIRPQIYQSATTAPTIWITYGWRYPYEPTTGNDVAGSRSYSDFINNNMLVREAYAIANSQFAFDNVGQVTVTLELWTKGAAEMRRIRIEDSADAGAELRKKIEGHAKRIAQAAEAAGFKTNGSSKEIRGYQVLEAAERGAFPEYSTPDIQKAINDLDAAAKEGKVDRAAAKVLIDELRSYYETKDNKSLELKKQVESTATKMIQKKIDEVVNGCDPFLFFASSGDEKKNALVSAINAHNKQNSKDKILKFKKSLCSFGKLCSVFIASSLKCNDAIDEFQVFFHQFNSKAGLVANTNIADFPIEMPVFFDQYRSMVEQRRSESMTLEEFLKLCVDAQLSDERNLAYGLKSYYAPYESGKAAALSSNEALRTSYERALGTFVKPQIEFFIETTYASDGSGRDLLRRFELQASGNDVTSTKSGLLKKVMRLHIFDKANSPHEAQGMFLRASDGGSIIELPGNLTREQTNELSKKIEGILKSAPSDLQDALNVEMTNAKIVVDPSKMNYSDIKRFISNTMPSIIYGSNATMVVNANLASKMDPLMATSQMQMVSAKSGPAKVGQPNGSGVGGLPLQIIPAAMTMTTMGCPTLAYAQNYFVDFNTGTTADNIYAVTGLTHTISPGKFESQITFTFYDGYGRYIGAPTFTKYISQIKLPDEKK